MTQRYVHIIYPAVNANSIAKEWITCIGDAGQKKEGFLAIERPL